MIRIVDTHNCYRRRFPLVNYGLIAVDVVVFLVELSQHDPQAYIARWGAVPRRSALASASRRW
jgi:hypothetical protein